MKGSKNIKRLICTSVSAAITICGCNLTTMTAFGAESWDGTADVSWYNEDASEFTLQNPSQLAGLAKLVNDETDNFADKTILLGADIDFYPGADAEGWSTGKNIPIKSWQPIGILYETPFKGAFDGCGYTISGVYTMEADNVAGLFGYVGRGSEVKNLTIDNSYIYSMNRYSGGVCAYNNYAQLTNCQSSAKVCSDYYIAGGITGVNIGGNIQSCGNTGSVAGGKGAGGIMGECISGTSNSCYNSGRAGSATTAGGICGYMSDSTINDTYNTGEVSGRSIAGGIAGSVKGSNRVNNGYNIGNVKSENGVSFGISGEEDVICSNCYYLNGTAKDDSIEGSDSISEEMLTGDLTSKLGDAFVKGKDFPILSWQNNTEDPPVTTETATETSTAATTTTTAKTTATSSTTTAVTTTITTTNTTTTAIKAYSLGDCNGNRKIDIEDATMVLTYYAKNAAGIEGLFNEDEQLNMLAFYAADVSRDGNVSIEDATLILKYYASTAAGLKFDWNY